MKTINIDADVAAKIEAERKFDRESENDILRRLLGIATLEEIFVQFGDPGVGRLAEREVGFGDAENGTSSSPQEVRSPPTDKPSTRNDD